MKRKLLLIDDDEIAVFGIRRMLQSCAVNVDLLTFSNGQEALEFIQQNPTVLKENNVIFLDLNMPIMDGWQFLEEYPDVLGSEQPAPNLYILSSSINGDDRKRAVENTLVTDYILKPLTKTVVNEVFYA